MLESRRPLGLSGSHAPRVALGCGNFGGIGSGPELFGQGLSQDEAFALMDAACEPGLAHFDTADAYGGGRSEPAIGRWIASPGLRRADHDQPSTRCSPAPTPGGAPERIIRQPRRASSGSGVAQVELDLATSSTECRGRSVAVFERPKRAARSALVAYSFNAAQLTPRWRPACRRPSRTALADDPRGRTGTVRCARHGRSPTWRSARWPVDGSPVSTTAASGSRPGSRMTQRPGPYQGFVTTDLRRAGPAAGDGGRAGASRWPASRSPGCSPTNGWPRS